MNNALKKYNVFHLSPHATSVYGKYGHIIYFCQQMEIPKLLNGNGSHLSEGRSVTKLLSSHPGALLTQYLWKPVNKAGMIFFTSINKITCANIPQIIFLVHIGRFLKIWKEMGGIWVRDTQSSSLPFTHPASIMTKHQKPQCWNFSNMLVSLKKIKDLLPGG